MNQNSSPFTPSANFFARSIQFWGSERAQTMPTAVFPSTAYNAFVGNSLPTIYAGRLGPNTPSKSDLIDLTIMMLYQWQRPMDCFYLQQLRWALTNISALEQSQVYRIFNRESVHPMKSNQTTLPPDVVSKLTMSLAQLEQALLEKDPMMPQHLRASHQLLISYPETVHLLDDDEIARLISAAQIHTGIEIVKLNTPKTAGRKKVTADDL